MKKMKKILSGVSAAALVFGSMSSYVAFASASATTKAPTVAAEWSGDWSNKPENLKAPTMKDGVIEIENLARINNFSNATFTGSSDFNGKAPLKITYTNEAFKNVSADNIVFTNYGWDSEGNKSGNFDTATGKFTFYLDAAPAAKKQSDSSVNVWTYKDGKYSYNIKIYDKNKGTTASVDVVLKDPTAVATVEYKSVSTTFPTTFTGDKKLAAEAITKYMTASVDKKGTVTVKFDKTKEEIEAIRDGSTLLTQGAPTGVNPVYLKLETNISKTKAAATDFDLVTSTYDWDDGAHKDWNFKDGSIMLWVKAIQTNNTKEVKYKIDGVENKITIKFEYAFSNKDTKTNISVTGGAGAVPEGTIVKVTPGKDDPKGQVSYDITLTNADGKQSVQPAKGEKLTVTVPVPETLKEDAAKLKVFYEKGEGFYEDMNAKPSEDKKSLVFDTDHFSKYIITTTDLNPDYKATAATAKNGKVEVKGTSKKGDTKTVTVTPDKGYELDKLTITDAAGKAVEYTAKTDGTYTFVQPASAVTVTATFKSTAATDPDDKPVNPDDDKKPTNPDDKPANPDDNKPTNPDDNKPGDNKPGATEDDNKDDNKGDNSGTDQKPTGIALAIAPVVLAGACAVVLAKKKK